MTVKLKVRDFMSRDVITVEPTTEITRVVQILVYEDISGVIVVDRSGNIVGVLTERDCIAAAVSAGYFDERAGSVEHYMSKVVETVALDDNLVDVGVRMTNSRYRRFPVIDEGRLVGVIGRREVLRALGNSTWFEKHD